MWAFMGANGKSIQSSVRRHHLVETCHIRMGLKQPLERKGRFLWLWALVGSPGLEARLDRSLGG